MGFFKEIWAAISKRNYKTTFSGILTLAGAAATGYMAYATKSPALMAAAASSGAAGVGQILAADANPKVQAAGAKVEALGGIADSAVPIANAVTTIIQADKDNKDKTAQVFNAIQAVSSILPQMAPQAAQAPVFVTDAQAASAPAPGPFEAPTPPVVNIQYGPTPIAQAPGAQSLASALAGIGGGVGQ